MERREQLICVLLYDMDYMGAHETRHPGYYRTTMVDTIEDTRRLNEEIVQTVRGHPDIAQDDVLFFEDPFKLISAVAVDPGAIKCIINFCDDFSDRSELWSLPVLFELLGIPCSGYGTRGLASHNKFYAYSVAGQMGIPVPKTALVTRYIPARVSATDYPVFVKPADAGGSEGITFQNLARDDFQLDSIIQELLALHRELIVSEYLPGDELVVGIMRYHGEVVPLPIRQVTFRNFHGDPAVITHDFKWDKSTLGGRELQVKVFDGSPTTRAEVINDSVRLFNAFGCKDYARVDWKLDAGGRPNFIDFNENPMISDGSSFTWCLERGGYTRHDLFVSVIDNVLADVDRTGRHSRATFS